MIIDALQYRPKPGELLYHYCSPSTLLAVVQNRTLRLSSVASMNDSQELQWGLRLIATCAQNRWADETQEMFSELMETFTNRVGFLASCFSTEWDMLSQWRAYADDGRGFAIGFDPVELASIPSRIIKVCYERGTQERLLSEALSSVLIEEGVEVSDEEGQSRINDLIELLFDLIGFKNPAFREEQEVRLVKLLYHSVVDDSLILPEADAAGTLKIQFQMRGSRPSPFIDVPLPGASAGIREIVIGPRAEVAEREVQLMLGTLGIRGIALRRSEASYR